MQSRFAIAVLLIHSLSLEGGFYSCKVTFYGIFLDGGHGGGIGRMRSLSLSEREGEKEREENVCGKTPNPDPSVSLSLLLFFGKGGERDSGIKTLSFQIML